MGAKNRRSYKERKEFWERSMYSEAKAEEKVGEGERKREDGGRSCEE